MDLNRRVFLGSMSAGVALAQNRGGAYTFEPDPAGKTLKAPDGTIVFTYLTKKPEGVPLAGNSACCFHPVNTPSGERVTDIAPPDHRDHRGAFFAWGNMEFQRKDGVQKGDFWGWGHYAPIEGRVIVNRDLKLVRANAQSAEVAVRNDWMIGTDKVLEENTTAVARAERGARILDLDFRFTSDSEFTVGQMAFTGFVLRCRKDGKYFLSNSAGKVDLPDSNATKPETDWPPAPWYSHTIALDSGKTVSGAVVDHPSNPPSPWHEPRSVAFLNPCISAPGPITVPAGKPLNLKYRVVTVDGEFPAGLMDTLAAEFRKS